MPDNVTASEVSIVRKAASIDNPILRHFIKKHRLNDQDTLVLGALLELTDQMITPIKTTYRAIADMTGLGSMKVYHSIESLHRYRIIEYRPSNDYVYLSFRELAEPVEEITLAHSNLKRIKKLEEDMHHVKRSRYVPSDDLFDILYPMVGKLVSRKIAEAFRQLVVYVNDRLDSSLSMRMWRYRFMSYRTGLPLAEIILRESLPFYIDEVFIIEKKSSLLLGHASRTGVDSVDRDLVGGMLAAINDFVRTSFKRRGSGVNEIIFGEWKITIAESVYFYAAVVSKGSPDIDFDGRLDAVMADVHSEYRGQLKGFDGSMKEVEGIERPFQALIEETNTVRASSTGEERPLSKVRALGVAAAVILAAFIAWTVYGAIRDHRREKRLVAQVNEAIPPYTHDVEIDIDGGTAVVTGTVGSRQTAEAINGVIRSSRGIDTVKNRAVIADYRSVELVRGEYDRLYKEIRMFQLLAVKQELEKIVVQFPAGVTAVANPQMLQIRRAYEILRHYPDIEVDIVAFNDPAGGVAVNKRLAEGRVDAIRDTLLKMGIDGGRLKPTDFDPEVLSSDPRYAEFRDTRGVMMFVRFPD